MKTLYQTYAALKQRIPGNREHHGFEYTFGMPGEEQRHITPTQRYIVRILSEVEFSIRLSEELGGKYDGLIAEVLAYLNTALDDDGTLTKSVCRTAEENLVSYSYDFGCADVLLKMLPGFVGSNFAIPEDVFSVWCEGETVCYNDDSVRIQSLLQSEEMSYRAVLKH